MKRMLIDAAHPEETRVAVLDGNQLEEFDVESSSRKQLKGNIYLAKVTRVEPSLQAAFVDYGGNRHGFLAFNEIHPDYYQIPVADRERLIAEQAEEDAEHERAEEAHEEARDAADQNEQAEQPADESDSATRAMPAAMSEGEHVEREPSHDDDHGHEGDGSSDELDASQADSANDETGASPSDDTESGETQSADAESGETDSGDNEAPERAPAEIIEHDIPAKPLETIGGDDLDDAGERNRPMQRALRRYKIQEVIKRRQVLLVQVVKEERGNKGAALTTYLSLAGRYCVLMPNTGKGGGISRKIGQGQDRKRLKSIISDLDVPPGMAMIVRTAGADRGKAEIKRDYDYLLRLWNDIRNLTLKSSAPALINAEANIINRAIRDLYTRDIDEIIVEGDEAYRMAKDLMKMLTPSHAKKVQAYKDASNIPLFSQYRIENQLEAMNSPTVQLKSGGYIVINATEALVAIDVNSGRATRGRNIEETALKTNTEAATEIARQLRLRDLAGLIVIDFIDMDHSRNQVAVERRLKDAMRRDRARIQIGRISPFGLLELSRQRLRPSLAETVSDMCPHCGGTGILRSTESTALHVLRGIEEEVMKRRSHEITVAMPTAIALYLLNHKRSHLSDLEAKFETRILVASDDSLIPPNFNIERTQAIRGDAAEGAEMAESTRERPERDRNDRNDRSERHERNERAARPENGEREPRRDNRDVTARRPDGEGGTNEDGTRRRRRRRGRKRSGEAPNDGANRNETRLDADAETSGTFDEDRDLETGTDMQAGQTAPTTSEDGDSETTQTGEHGDTARRRRGRRGGRGRNRTQREDGGEAQSSDAAASSEHVDATSDMGDAGDTETDSASAQPDTSAEGEPRRRVRRRRGPRPEIAADGMANDADSQDSQADAAPIADTRSDDEPARNETASVPAYSEPAYVPVEPAQQHAAPVAPSAPEDEAPAGPPRRGWWQKLME